MSVSVFGGRRFTGVGIMGCLLLIVSGSLAAEPAKPVKEKYPPYIVHYLKRQAEFRKENRAFQHVVLLGDSITEGFNVKKYFPGHNVLNRGISSDTIGISPDPKDLRGVLKRLDTSVFDCCTTHVFLMIGINDLGDRRTPEDMIVGYRKILRTIHDRAPWITVHVESVLPTRGRFAFHNANVVKFNRMIRAAAKEFGYPYMDLHKMMSDDKGELRADLTREGLHINAAAYEIWKKQIDKAMGWSD